MSVKKPALVEEDLFDLFASLDPEPEEPADTPAPKIQKEPLFLDCGHLNFSSSEAQLGLKVSAVWPGGTCGLPLTGCCLKETFDDPSPNVSGVLRRKRNRGGSQVCVWMQRVTISEVSATIVVTTDPKAQRFAATIRCRLRKGLNGATECRSTHTYQTQYGKN
jgi:hypothetical protein